MYVHPCVFSYIEKVQREKNHPKFHYPGRTTTCILFKTFYIYMYIQIDICNITCIQNHTMYASLILLFTVCSSWLPISLPIQRSDFHKISFTHHSQGATQYMGYICRWLTSSLLVLWQTTWCWLAEGPHLKGQVQNLLSKPLRNLERDTQFVKKYVHVGWYLLSYVYFISPYLFCCRNLLNSYESMRQCKWILGELLISQCNPNRWIQYLLSSYYQPDKVRHTKIMKAKKICPCPGRSFNLSSIKWNRPSSMTPPLRSTTINILESFQI